MRFLSNCIPVQAHTRMIQRRDRLPNITPIACESHLAAVLRRAHERRAAITSGRPFRISILADSIESSTSAGIRPEVNSLKRSINRTKCDASQDC